MEFALAELCDQVMTARAGHKPMFIVGGQTKAFYGNTREITIADGHCLLDMTVYKGVVDYHPSELVVTVRAGTPLAALQEVLDQERQMLAFEPPHFGAAATVGGCISAGLSGPGRMAYGSVRDFVLGARLLDAQGRLLSFGGEVVKNVAGYDVSRLLAGAMGTFGALVEVSLKVVPKPAVQRTVCLPATAEQARAQFARWRVLPLPITASTWVSDETSGAGMIWLRLAGSAIAVDSAHKAIGGDVLADDDAHAFWQSLREQTHPFFWGDKPLWRLALPPAAPVASDLGAQLIEWGGAQRWVRGDFPAGHMRERAEQAGGHATLFRTAVGAARPASGVFHPPAPALQSIMQRLKNEFDPWHLFNPGRLLPES